MRHPELLAHGAPQLVGEILVHELLEVPLHDLRGPGLEEAVHDLDLSLDAHVVLAEEPHGRLPQDVEVQVVLHDGHGLCHGPSPEAGERHDALRGDDHLEEDNPDVLLCRVPDLAQGDEFQGPPEAVEVDVQPLLVAAAAAERWLQRCPEAAVHVREHRQQADNLQYLDDECHGLVSVHELVCPSHGSNCAECTEHLQEPYRLEHLGDLRQAGHGQELRVQSLHGHPQDEVVRDGGDEIDPKPEMKVLPDTGPTVHDQSVLVDVAGGEIQAHVRAPEECDEDADGGECGRCRFVAHEDELERREPQVHHQDHEGQHIPRQADLAHR
mmetsp:Transcript_17941/g.62983  ORF Transcript_17941/g.62983 Transcript_17941/m.62983 type:complete len:326 (+) Transcript_17941:655-1632(+)